MKNTLIILGIIIVIVGGGIYLTSMKKTGDTTTPPPATGSGNTVTVEMNASGFTPDSITIKQNDVVVFKNTDTKSHWPASNIHPTHLIYPEFDPQRGIPGGESWSFTFGKVGTWYYHDHLYPDLTGKVVVVTQ